VQVVRRLATVGLAAMLGGCASGIPLLGSVCDGEPSGRLHTIVMAVFGCDLVSSVAIPKPALPPSFRNATAEDQLDPFGAGRSADPNIPARSVGVSAPSPAKAPQAAQAGPAADNVAPQAPADWWRLFGSPELTQLEQQALANNHDLKAAMARVNQAEAFAGAAAGALLPSVQTNGRGQSTAPNGGVGNRIPQPDGQSQRLYQLGVVASYEIDFWGKNRATMESALAAAQSSAYDRETVAMTLTADVANSYLQYLTLADRLTVAVANVQNVTEVLATVQKRFTIGEGSDIEVQQQATALAQARAVVPAIALAKEQARLQLSTLVGVNADDLNLTGSSLATLTLPTPPRTVPSSLLTQRPDLRKAEFDLVSANSDIAAARGRLLPSFTLSAETGYGSNFLTSLFTPVGWYSILASSVSGVLYDNGKSLSDIDLRKAVSNERSETYRQRVLDAVRDVEQALASVRSSAEVEAAQQVALERATRAYELAQMGLQLGTSDYLTILETERTRYQVEDSRVQARLDRMNAAVALFRSLGGSTEAAPAS
jgi:multidrug efflux system outer membrane protein